MLDLAPDDLVNSCRYIRTGSEGLVIGGKKR
jgi:hypothetical protein